MREREETRTTSRFLCWANGTICGNEEDGLIIRGHMGGGDQHHSFG